MMGAPAISALPRPGVCMFCGCTDLRACMSRCCWVDLAHTICSDDRCIDQLIDERPDLAKQVLKDIFHLAVPA